MTETTSNPSSTTLETDETTVTQLIDRLLDEMERTGSCVVAAPVQTPEGTTINMKFVATNALYDPDDNPDAPVLVLGRDRHMFRKFTEDNEDQSNE